MKQKTTTPSCQFRTLAHGSTAHIQCCSECGTVSVHVGAVSLRFHPAALESLWNTLGEALAALHAAAKRDGGGLTMVRGPHGRA